MISLLFGVNSNIHISIIGLRVNIKILVGHGWFRVLVVTGQLVDTSVGFSTVPAVCGRKLDEECADLRDLHGPSLKKYFPNTT